MNGLATEHSGLLTVDVFDAGTPESKTAIAGYGFDNHGIVMFDAKGGVQKTMNGHEWTEAQVRSALQDVMGGS